MTVANSLLWVMGGCHTPVVLVHREATKPHTLDHDDEGMLLLVFRHFSTWVYLTRLMPMVVAEGKFDALSWSKYIAGDTCKRKNKQIRRMSDKEVF